MDINITCLISENVNLMDYSASKMEIGQDAGNITWSNAIKSKFKLLTTKDERNAAKNYFKSTGGWSREEIDRLSIKELNALMLQFAAGDLREYLEAQMMGEEHFKEWEENFGGRIYQHGINYFYYLGM